MAAPNKKRKAGPQPRTTSAKQPRKHTIPTKLDMRSEVQDPKNKPFRLLDLPPELRNLVYEKCLEIYPLAHLSRFITDRNLLTDCPLIVVSKQVREEFMPIMSLHVSTIRTTVRNYQFGHIIAYMNRISDAELQKLEADTKSGTRVMRLEIDFGIPAGGYCYGRTERWLDRIDKPEKRGSGVEYSYMITDPDWQPSLYRRPEGSKSQREWKKIQEAAVTRDQEKA